MSVTYYLPLRHPAVLLSFASILIGYTGLAYEALLVSREGTPKDWIELFVGLIGLPALTWLFLCLVARPQDFVESASTVVAMGDQGTRLGRLRKLGYVILALWFVAIVCIGGGYVFRQSPSV